MNRNGRKSPLALQIRCSFTHGQPVRLEQTKDSTAFTKVPMRAKRLPSFAAVIHRAVLRPLRIPTCLAGQRTEQKAAGSTITILHSGFHLPMRIVYLVQE